MDEDNILIGEQLNVIEHKKLSGKTNYVSR